MVVQVDEFANTDPDAFLADLKTQGRTRDTEIMLQGFGFKGEDIDELFPEPPTDEEIARILQVGGVSDEEINRIIAQEEQPPIGVPEKLIKGYYRRTARAQEWVPVEKATAEQKDTWIPTTTIGPPPLTSFWEDPAGWWERRHQEYIDNVPSEQKAAAIRRESLANTAGIIGLVNSPLWRGGLAATDIAGIALLAYTGFQAAKVGWNFFLRSYLKFEFDRAAGARGADLSAIKLERTNFVNAGMAKIPKKWLSEAAIRKLFRLGPDGYRISAGNVEQAQSDIAALVQREVALMPQGTFTGAQLFGGLPPQPGVLTVAIWNAMTAAQRVSSAERAGLAGITGNRPFEELTESEKTAMAKVLPETAPDVVPPTAFEATLQRELVKEGFAAPVPEAVAQLPEELKGLAENARNLSKEEFLTQYEAGLNEQNLTRRETAQRIDAYIKRTLKITPEQFYDTYVQPTPPTSRGNSPQRDRARGDSDCW